MTTLLRKVGGRLVYAYHLNLVLSKFISIETVSNEYYSLDA